MCLLISLLGVCLCLRVCVVFDFAFSGGLYYCSELVCLFVLGVVLVFGLLVVL